MKVNVREIEALRSAALRLDEAPSPEKTGLIWGRLYTRCAGTPAAGPAFGLLYEGEGYEACWPLLPGQPIADGLRERTTETGWYAAAIHEGGYDRLRETFVEILEKWLPHSGFRRREGPLLERYLIDPRDAAEADLRTEACVPVAPDPIE
ncbi:MAG: GyrI-like domain-containing protein [bacterium]|nr:GyrI-like domain-containing protein [bacterium]